VLMLDRDEAARAADAAGLALWGLDPSAGPAPSGTGSVVGRVVGRRRPSGRQPADVETGLGVVAALAPFGTGAGAVVARGYVLAIEAAEGPAAMMERAAGLPQWGLRWADAGVMVRRAGDGGSDADVAHALLARAAAQRLAGMAVLGTPAALAPYEDAGRLADRHDIFLVLCELV
jgi:UDP-2,3-diacylglucosamine hydrolase